MAARGFFGQRELVNGDRKEPRRCERWGHTLHRLFFLARRPHAAGRPDVQLGFPIGDILLSGEARRPKISRTGHFCRKCQIGKRATFAELDAEGWTEFAKDAGIGFPLVRRRIAEICENVRSAAGEVAADLLRPGLDADALTGYANLLRQRAERCASSVQRRSI
jgi:hypothetical protein